MSNIYFIKIDPHYIELGYRKHHAQLLTYLANWQKYQQHHNKKAPVILSTNKIATDLAQGASTIRRWIAELRDIAIACHKKTTSVVGGYWKRVSSYELIENIPIVEYSPKAKQYSIVNAHFEPENSQNEPENSQNEPPTIYKNKSTKPTLKNQTPKEAEREREWVDNQVLAQPLPCDINPHCMTEKTSDCTKQDQPSISNYSAADATKNVNTDIGQMVTQQKELYEARRNSYRPISWLEQGQANGLWQTKEELNSFRIALTAYARSQNKGEGWIVAVLNNIATQGMSSYWDEFKAGVPIGTIEQQGWEIAPGQTLPAFVSWLTQNLRQNGDNPADTMARVGREIKFNGKLHWEAFKRRLDREVEVQQQAERLGVTYMLPGELRPQQTPDDRTAHNAMAYLNQESVHQFNQRPLASSALKQICNSENKSPQPLPAADDSVLEQTLDGEIEPDIPPPPHVAAALEQIGVRYHIAESAPAAELEEVAPIDQGDLSHKPFVPPTVAELREKLAAKREAIAKSTNNAIKQQQEADRAFERELGEECLRYRHDPDTAKRWLENNRTRLVEWLSRRDQHDHDRWLRNNPWLSP